MYSLLSRYTTLGVGGPARVTIARSAGELMDGGDALILGRGSNILASDDGFDGRIVIDRFESIAISGEETTVGSGTRLSVLCAALCENGLGGMEWAAGIPGTAGGAVVMNAGAFGGEMKDVLLYADVMRGGNVVRLSRDELKLGYRSSAICAGDVILSARLRLCKRGRRAISALMSEYAAKRRATQPRGKSAGSVFKNPPGISIARLIDGLGLKGYRVGGAEVSREHANIIVNTGGATARDVYEIIAALKEALLGVGVAAKEEIIYIGEF